MYAAFKASQKGKVMKGFFKQPYEVRKEYGLDPDLWVADLRKEYPNAYLPTVQQICRKWMTIFSKQHQLQKQSGLTKKEWSTLLSHAASAVARCVKEKKIKLEAAKRVIMEAAIHDTYKVYYKKQFNGWNTTSNQDVLNMIRLLRQKKIDKDEEAENGKLGPKEIELFNRLESRADPDKLRYNKEIYEPYLKKFVERGANMKGYRLPEMIKSNYVTLDQVKEMINDKYKRGDFSIKSKEDLEKLYEVTENVFNHMEDPNDSLNTVSASNYNRDLTKRLYDIANNVSPQQYQNIVNQNVKIEDEMSLNVPSSSSSSFSDMSSFKKESDDQLEMPGYSSGIESETETETDTDATCASESDIIPEDPNASVQNNNNTFIPREPSDASRARKIFDDRNKKDPVLKHF
jgi:hypothetical protein